MSVCPCAYVLRSAIFPVASNQSSCAMCARVCVGGWDAGACCASVQLIWLSLSGLVWTRDDRSECRWQIYMRNNGVDICQIWVTIYMDNKIFWLIANDFVPLFCPLCAQQQQQQQRVYLYIIKSNYARAVDLDLHAT